MFTYTLTPPLRYNILWTLDLLCMLLLVHSMRSFTQHPGICNSLKTGHVPEQMKLKFLPSIPRACVLFHSATYTIVTSL
jgi:hypothetical protein